MQDTIKIRSARPEDATVLAAAERAIAETPGFLVSKPHELVDDNFAKTISQLESCPNGKYLVAELCSTIVGHGMLNPLPLYALSHVVQLTGGPHGLARERNRQNPAVGTHQMGKKCSNGRKD